ncbi:MAG: hypothetical protein EBX52_06235 [Proteobacteria bacterium]|nr:hypothetical protein [Pseudomonadota bacterium]
MKNRLYSMIPAILFGIAGVLPQVSRAFSLDPQAILGCTEPGKDGIRRCLKLTLLYYCDQIAGQEWYNPMSAPRELRCAQSVTAMVDALDPYQLDMGEPAGVPKAPHEVAFSSSVEAAFLNPKLSHLISSLAGDFQDSCQFGTPRSLWSSLSTTYGSRAGLKMAAIAFQSVSFFANGNPDATDGGLMQVEAVKRLAAGKITMGKLFPSRAEALKREARILQGNADAYHDLAREWINRKIKNRECPDYQFYPEIPNRKDLDPTFHHFYVPAYLSYKLLARGYTPKWALMAPFIMNALWEFRKIDRKLNQNRWPYSTPLPARNRQEAAKVEMNYRKMYTAYIGSLWGMDLQSQARSYEDFRARFKAGDFSFIWDGEYLK